MKKLIYSIIAVFAVLVFSTTPVYADCVETSILGGTKCTKDEATNELKPDTNGSVSCACDNNDGSSIYDILNTVVDIMSVCIGILGVIGITIVGIQYLTAAGNEEQTRKAKRRMFEIVIGIVAYVILYAGLRFLLPEFNGTKQPKKSASSYTTEGDCTGASYKWTWDDQTNNIGHCE